MSLFADDRILYLKKKTQPLKMWETSPGAVGHWGGFKRLPKQYRQLPFPLAASENLKAKLYCCRYAHVEHRIWRNRPGADLKAPH